MSARTETAPPVVVRLPGELEPALRKRVNFFTFGLKLSTFISLGPIGSVAVLGWSNPLKNYHDTTGLFGASMAQAQSQTDALIRALIIPMHISTGLYIVSALVAIESMRYAPIQRKATLAVIFSVLLLIGALLLARGQGMLRI